MKLSKEFLLELKYKKAMRRIKSKKGSFVGAQDALQRAKRRLLARAMTADIGGEGIKAQDIAHGADKIEAELSRRLSGPKSTVPVETGTFNRDIFPIVRSMQTAKDAEEISKRVIQYGVSKVRREPKWVGRAQEVALGQGDKFMGTVPLRKGALGQFTPYLRNKIENLHGHIERSMLAGAAVRMGGKASDVPEFKPKPFKIVNRI